MPRSRKIAVLRPGALGDGVLALPVLASLRAAEPDAHLLAVGHPVLRLAVGAGLVSEWMAFDDPRLLGLFAATPACDALADCDLCIAFTSRQSTTLAEGLRAVVRGRALAWPVESPRSIHITDHLLGVLASAGIPIRGRSARLEAQATWLRAANALLEAAGVARPYVVIHPGSGGAAKRWPVRNFIEVARALDVPVLWLLGPAERESHGTERAVRAAPHVLDTPSLPELAGVLAQCAGYVGNDSGVSHLAAAVGAPTVAVFGPTDPAVWAPRGERAATIGGAASGGFAGVTADAACRALRDLMHGTRAD